MFARSPASFPPSRNNTTRILQQGNYSIAFDLPAVQTDLQLFPMFLTQSRLLLSSVKDLGMQKPLFFCVLTRSAWSYSVHYDPATTMPVFFGSVFIKIVFTVSRAYVNCFSSVEWRSLLSEVKYQTESPEGSEREVAVSAASCTQPLTIGAQGPGDSTWLNFLEKELAESKELIEFWQQEFSESANMFLLAWSLVCCWKCLA